MPLPTFRRWGSILSYAFLSSLSCLAILYHANSSASAPFTFDAFLPQALTLAGGASAILWILNIAKPKLNHFRLRHIVFHPSFLIAIPLGGAFQFAALATINATFPASESENFTNNALQVFIGSIVFLPTLLLCLSIFWLIRRTAKLLSPDKKSTPRESTKRDLAKLEDLLSWIRQEEPIGQANADLFNFTERANQILSTLADKRFDIDGCERPQSVVIQGPYGSGKTSLVRLAEHRHKNEEAPKIPFLFVHLNCWGFESTLRLHEHVLARCVEALHERIDCTGLRDMPARYAKALSSASPNWLQSVLATALARSPEEQIGRLGPLLEAANLRLIAVIEDTDRNSSGFDSGQIESLLYHFRTVKGLSFIFTSGPQDRIEYPKIAERIFYLPSLPQARVSAMLNMVYKHCREKHPCAQLANDYDGNPISNADEELSYSDTHPLSWPDSVCQLIARPRQLKHLLRALIQTWDTLAGEVELDELVMILTLRHAAPSAHTFLGSHINQLRSLPVNDSANDDKISEQKQNLESKWKMVKDSANYDSESAGLIISALLPQAAEIFDGPKWAMNHRVQSVCRSGGPDYWTRINDEFLGKDEVRDQIVIALAKGSATDQDSSAQLAQLIVDSSEAADLLIFFSEHYRFPIEVRLDWLSKRYDLLRAKSGSASTVGDSQTFGSKARDRLGKKLTARYSESENDILPWLRGEFDRSLPANIRFACELYLNFAQKKDFAGAARQSIHQKLKALFEQPSTIAFSDGLDPCFPDTLYHLLFCDGDQNTEALLARPEDWTFLAPYILEEVKTRPHTTIPAVAFAFGNALSGDGICTHVEFRNDDVQKFFGDRAPEVYSAIASYDPDSSPLTGNELERLRLAIEAAKCST